MADKVIIESLEEGVIYTEPFEMENIKAEKAALEEMDKKSESVGKSEEKDSIGEFDCLFDLESDREKLKKKLERKEAEIQKQIEKIKSREMRILKFLEPTIIRNLRNVQRSCPSCDGAVLSRPNQDRRFLYCSNTTCHFHVYPCFDHPTNGQEKLRVKRKLIWNN